MLKPIFDPAKGRMRVIGYCSGSGNTLWKAYELQQKMEQTAEGCPFEIVGVFADNPESKAVAAAKASGIPCCAIDIRKYYEDRNTPLKDRTLRAEYDKEALAMLEDLDADVILLAGYVWATTDVILDRYTVINVHPADLAVVDETGKRLLAGANGIKSSFKHNMEYLRASSHIATKELDAGPLLVRSPKIPIDYAAHPDEEERFRYYLKLVNDQNRLVGARAVLEVALGNFAKDEEGKLYYKNEPAPTGLCVEDWNENIPYFERETEKLLNPKSVAVIGASNKPGIGKAIMRNLLEGGFEGKLYAVNKKGEAVDGVPGYVSIKDIPDEVEMAVLSIPSGGALQVAEECGQKGVKVIVCITAGFREVGGAGIEAEKKLLAIIDKYNMRMTGPNCMGIVNLAESAKLSATINSQKPPAGHVAFLTQSGALGASLVDFADELDVGFSVVVSLGNMSNVNPCDLLPYLEKDPNTQLVCMYMETIPQPHRFEQVLKKMTKPVIMVKSGRTAEGAAAASSHTGSLSGNDNAVDAFLRKSGVIRAESLEDAFLLASAMSKMPKLKGNRVGIISNAGGLGTLTSDALSKNGFTLPQLSEEEQKELAAKLLPEASTHNPLDLVAPAPPAHYAEAAKMMTSCGKYDAIVVDCVPPATVDTGEVGEAILDILKNSGLPIFSCFFGPRLGAGGKAVMKKGGIPTFSFPDQMVKTMRYMIEKTPKQDGSSYSAFRPGLEERLEVSEILEKAPKGAYLNAEDCFKVLSLYGIPVVKTGWIPAEGDIQNDIPYPVAAKVDHPEIIHKSDVGGVRLDLMSDSELADLQAEWREKFPGLRGIQLQQQIKGSPEIIIGVSSDPAMGHTILAGLGGTLVEVFKDVSFGHVPLDDRDPDDMLDSLKCKKLLEGYRGSVPADIIQLKEIIMRVNRLIRDYPDITEMDINPLIPDNRTGRFYAVDARIKL